MSSQALPTPAEILQRFYDAETIYMAAPPDKRDISGMLAALSPKVKLIQSPDLPYGGVYEGHAGFERWSKVMASYFDVLEVQNPQVFEKEGSDRVLVLSNLKLKVRGKKTVLEFPLVQSMGVDRKEGVLTELRTFYWNVGGLNEAVGR